MVELLPGAVCNRDGTTIFTVWAPFSASAGIHLVAPMEKILPMQQAERGYFTLQTDEAPSGSHYQFRLENGGEYSDPASRYQPRGVFGPSQVLSQDFAWGDGEWRGISLQDYIIYELHTGAFTREGTFEAVIGKLPYLRELGITAVELMPVAQFSGSRNWGYDGVFPWAVHNSYGGPDGLKRLVNACHSAGLAVILDVVYNHLGPEGNNLARFGPYFSEKYHTGWGNALNFDGPYSDEVRRFFIGNALYWVTEFHIDALRLDALHAILDTSAYTFLEELADNTHRRAADLDRLIWLIGESDDNNARMVRPRSEGGIGLDAQWNDDFHHALHCLLTGEKGGYYRDFGNIGQLAKSMREGFIYSGQYSEYRRRRHGTSSAGISPERLVVCSQNHDQVGNRAQGERLTQLTDFESLKLAAGIMLLSPYIPLLFMGEEYGEIAPFLYFVSHTDPHLIEAVRKGRREEFRAFRWDGEMPDPQDERTFLRSKLDWSLTENRRNRTLHELYRVLISLRRGNSVLRTLTRDLMQVQEDELSNTLFVQRRGEGCMLAMLFNFSHATEQITYEVAPGQWHKILDSADERWLGSGSGNPEQAGNNGKLAFVQPTRSFAVYRCIVQHDKGDLT